jgi:DNA invertase Pin-like site-specific DNA recombinase
MSSYSSLDNQVQYYTELINSKPDWTFIQGYIDEGLSGISTKKRDSFNRMISDAKSGRFDLIITKEISRFSRSTLDSIRYTQELLDYNVGVFFQMIILIPWIRTASFVLPLWRRWLRTR